MLNAYPSCMYPNAKRSQRTEGLDAAPAIPYHTIPYHTIPYHTIPYQNVKFKRIKSFNSNVHTSNCYLLIKVLNAAPQITHAIQICPTLWQQPAITTCLACKLLCYKQDRIAAMHRFISTSILQTTGVMTHAAKCITHHKIMMWLFFRPGYFCLSSHAEYRIVSRLWRICTQYKRDLTSRCTNSALQPSLFQ